MSNQLSKRGRPTSAAKESYGAIGIDFSGDARQWRSISVARSSVDCVHEMFGAHPFEGPLSRDLLETLLPEYLAMSQAFLYLHAAA
jgi:hypothetical protein